MAALLLAAALGAPRVWAWRQTRGTGATLASGEQQVPVDGVARQFLVHLPAGFRAGPAYPLLIAFHDRYLPPRRWAQISGLDAVADRQNVIVIYPEAVDGDGGAWPGGGYQPESRFGKTSQALDGAEAVWTFLRAAERRSDGRLTGGR